MEKTKNEKFIFSKQKLGLNFINMLTQSFFSHRSQKRKKDSQVISHFTLLGSTCTKAACRTLVKSTPVANKEKKQISSLSLCHTSNILLIILGHSLSFVVCMYQNVSTLPVGKFLFYESILTSTLSDEAFPTQYVLDAIT